MLLMLNLRMSPLMGNYCIYILIDPRDQCIRYCGYSINPSNRYNEHISESLNGSGNTTKKVSWIRGLINNKLKPLMIITHRCQSKSDAHELEKLMIAHLRSEGHKLTNMTDGGHGWPDNIDYNHPSKIAAAIRNITAYNNSGAPNGFLGKSHGNHARRAIARSNRWRGVDFRMRRDAYSYWHFNSGTGEPASLDSSPFPILKVKDEKSGPTPAWFEPQPEEMKL